MVTVSIMLLLGADWFRAEVLSERMLFLNVPVVVIYNCSRHALLYLCVPKIITNQTSSMNVKTYVLKALYTGLCFGRVVLQQRWHWLPVIWPKVTMLVSVNFPQY